MTETNFSSDRQYFVDAYSRVDELPVSVLRRSSDGKELMTFDKADIKDLLTTGWQMPEVFSAKGRDGRTDIWGIICRPMNFNESRKYKVIEYIYAGPHNSFVPKTSLNNRTSNLIVPLKIISSSTLGWVLALRYLFNLSLLDL